MPFKNFLLEKFQLMFIKGAILRDMALKLLFFST